MYDYLVVGAGLCGAFFAYTLRKEKQQVTL